MVNKFHQVTDVRRTGIKTRLSRGRPIENQSQSVDFRRPHPAPYRAVPAWVLLRPCTGAAPTHQLTGDEPTRNNTTFRPNGFPAFGARTFSVALARACGTQSGVRTVPQTNSIINRPTVLGFKETHTQDIIMIHTMLLFYHLKVLLHTGTKKVVFLQLKRSFSVCFSDGVERTQ